MLPPPIWLLLLRKPPSPDTPACGIVFEFAAMLEAVLIMLVLLAGTIWNWRWIDIVGDWLFRMSPFLSILAMLAGFALLPALIAAWFHRAICRKIGES